MRRRTGGGTEAAGERPRAHGRAVGESLDRHGFVQMLLQPGQRLGEEVARHVGRQRQVDELGLAAITVWRHDHAAGDDVGNLRAVVRSDDVEAQIDPPRCRRT